jgi:hypothetical protein
LGFITIDKIKIPKRQTKIQLSLKIPINKKVLIIILFGTKIRLIYETTFPINHSLQQKQQHILNENLLKIFRQRL